MNIFTTKKPFIIAGPCSAESAAQMTSIGQALADSPVDMIRAGIWKPRSKPGFFEGLGEQALPWLIEAGKLAGKKVCTEVATPEQAELALRYGIDAVWIGARTTVNPFLVQELVEALKGTDMAVLIKNPINPDTELWCGGIERFLQGGLHQIAAIHRGFSSYEQTSVYRNKPNWAIPIEVKRRFTSVPVICDISHICGNRNLLQGVAQRAIDLDFDGLMVEIHPNPDAALSDAQQQITPHSFFTLLEQIQYRHKTASTATDEIEALRQIIDTLDAEIVDLIGKRMETVKSLAFHKRMQNQPFYQVERWREIIESRSAWGRKNMLSDDFILHLFQLIHDQSIRTQIQTEK